MTIVPYSVNHKEIWDTFVRQSKNGTFLFERNYMDCHARDLSDCSLMIYDGIQLSDDEMERNLTSDGLKAVFPANWMESERCVYSHQGMSYGGLLVQEDVTQQQMLEMMQLILMYFEGMYQAQRLVYKHIPYIYSVYPSGEDLYALYRAGARLLTRSVSTVVSMRNPLRVRTNRLKMAKKALDENLYIDRMVENDWGKLAEFWQLMEDRENDDMTHVMRHSLSEMQLLMERFPREIKLYLVRRIIDDPTGEEGTNSELLAGCLIFVTRQVAHVQYIASNDRGRETGALELLFRHLITERYKNMEYVDYGVSTENRGLFLNRELIALKEGFGGKSVCYDTYEVVLDRTHLCRMWKDLSDEDSEPIRYTNLKVLNDTFGPMLGNALNRVVRSGQYLMDNCSRNFARRYADYLGAKYCIPCGNGLDALTMIVRAYREMGGWQDDDEVIVSACASVATVLSITNNRLRPVFCEPSKLDCLMDARLLPSLLTGRTRAVMPVHLYGRMCDMQSICDFAHEHELVVIEDASHAHGSVYRGISAGRWGNASAFSFKPERNLGALGDAGCVVTEDAELARVVEMLQQYGYNAEDRSVPYMGFSSRMDEMQAAVLGVKLERLDADNDHRRHVATLYFEGIQNPLIVLQQVPRDMHEHVFNAFAVRCPARDRLRLYLKGRGIETRVPDTVPVYRHEAFARNAEGVSLPITDRLHKEVLLLPISPLMTDVQVARVVKALNEFNVEL